MSIHSRMDPFRHDGACAPSPESIHLPVVIVPGLDNSAPAHWQSHWQRRLPHAERIQQSDWTRPTLAEWTTGLMQAIHRRPGALLVAHSLGCALVAHVARLAQARHIAGALLVAPADVERAEKHGRGLNGFAPLPRERLPFPSLVVASQNDPFITLERASAFASDWRSTFVDLGPAGHINVESGYGPWSEGLALLSALQDAITADAEPRVRHG